MKHRPNSLEETTARILNNSPKDVLEEAKTHHVYEYETARGDAVAHVTVELGDIDMMMETINFKVVVVKADKNSKIRKGATAFYPHSKIINLIKNKKLREIS